MLGRLPCLTAETACGSVHFPIGSLLNPSLETVMALEVFYSYAHKDEDLRDELETHLVLLKRKGLITSWHDRRIGAGDELRGQIDAHVRSAQIILLLISADYLASPYCYDEEMKVALERQ